MISAEIVADSVSPQGVRLTTMQLIYPRFIHAEYMTHRVFSRNASSSRAIPVKRLIGAAVMAPAFFEKVTLNQPGMQGDVEVSPEVAEQFYAEWCELADIAAGYARRWSDPEGMNIHKQHVNRVMEPWHHIKVVHTATDMDNFFELRDHPDAQPEIAVLAKKMKRALSESIPCQLEPGQWHLPYVTEKEAKSEYIFTLLKVSAARCARVSYMKHDGSNSTVEEDCALHDALVGSKPMHLSPTEHQSLATSGAVAPALSSNLRGWVQYRKMLENGLDFI